MLKFGSESPCNLKLRGLHFKVYFQSIYKMFLSFWGLGGFLVAFEARAQEKRQGQGEAGCGWGAAGEAVFPADLRCGRGEWGD